MFRRTDAAAALLTRFKEALRRQHPDRLADDRPADTHQFANAHLRGQRLAGQNIAAHDPDADPLGNLTGDVAREGALFREDRTLLGDGRCQAWAAFVAGQRANTSHSNALLLDQI
jgi:hypothetical protein